MEFFQVVRERRPAVDVGFGVAGIIFWGLVGSPFGGVGRVTGFKTLYLAACEKIERNDLEARHEYAMNFADACDSYGGCAFRTLCCARDPQDFISNYTHYRWDPLALKPVSEQPSQEP